MQTISKMQIERYFAEMLDAKDVVRILAESVGKPTETAIEALIAQSVSHAQIEQSILADLGKCHRKTAGLFDPIRCDIRGGYNSHVEVFRK